MTQPAAIKFHFRGGGNRGMSANSWTLEGHGLGPSLLLVNKPAAEPGLLLDQACC
jgi:hypothetical protein